MQRVETLIWAAFPPSTIKILKRLGEIGANVGIDVYLIGGVVRDMILHRPIKDIDIMLEGDALGMLKELKENWSSYFSATATPTKLVTFPHYQTAKLAFDGEIAPAISNLDFSRARKETYAEPAAKPAIVPGTLQDDLARRDYSINALAISLRPVNYGELIDLFSGTEALKKRELAVLHDASFRDDPVRIIRGVRFNSRFGFNFSERTRELVQAAIEGNLLERVTPGRRFEELIKALNEERAIELLQVLEQLKVLQQIHPEFRLSQRALSTRVVLPGNIGNNLPSDFYLGLLLSDFSEQTSESILRSFQVSPKRIAALLQCRAEVLRENVS